MPPPAPKLMDDLIDEILVRLPPEDPGCLFRASLVCQRWRGLLTGRDFAGRYRKFHRSPPLMGFFENQFLGCWLAAPSSSASPVPPIHPGHRRLDALDSRHGLVLLELKDPEGDPLSRLVVWDPLRRRQWELAGPVGFRDHTCSAAVLCAADGCDHLDCRGTHGDGPFFVGCVCSDEEGTFYASMYSSEARAWSPVTSVKHPVPPLDHSVVPSLISKSKILVGNALYFTCHCEPSVLIVRYDVVSWELSIMKAPSASNGILNQYALVETNAGVLGFANLRRSRLCLWSIQASTDGRTVGWGKHRVVELLPPLPFSAELYVAGFTEGVGVIVVTNDGTFTIEVTSGRVKNVSGKSLHAFPYSSFYTPDQAGGIMLPLNLASSSENIEAAQDPLLQQTSMKAGEEDRWEEEGEWKGDCDDGESGEEVEEDLEQAHDLFDSWSQAIVDGEFDFAKFCTVDALELMFLCHGKLSPKCACTYYIYGCTLLYKPHPDSEPSSERDDAEYIMSLPDNHDFELSLKMLHIARIILKKCLGSSMEKVKIFSALADLKILSTLGRGSMRREDVEYSLHICFKALAISDDLIEPDNYWIIKLNVSICLIFESSSNIGDAVAYCAKAISLCKSRVFNLKNAKEALLLDKGDIVSAAEAGSERRALKYEIEFLTGMSCKLEKKLENLEQAMSTLSTKASGEQNVGDATPRAASSTHVSNLLELLSIFDPVLRKSNCCTPWPERALGFA